MNYHQLMHFTAEQVRSGVAVKPDIALGTEHRDAFSQNHIVRGSGLSRWIEDRLDALFCRHADGVSSVSDPITQHYARRFGVAARTITNGYNPDLFDAGGPSLSTSARNDPAAPFVLRYLGTIYKPENIPLALFDALRERHARRADARPVRVEFIGDCAPVARLVQERVTRIASAASPRAVSEPRPY